VLRTKSHQIALTARHRNLDMTATTSWRGRGTAHGGAEPERITLVRNYTSSDHAKISQALTGC
jgi:hypothetical protein